MYMEIFTKAGDLNDVNDNNDGNCSIRFYFRLNTLAVRYW